MAGFGFNEAQEMFCHEVRNFAQKEIAPGAKVGAKLEEIPWDLLKKIGDAGLFGVNLPEKYGGQPADWVSFGIVIEELSRAEFILGLPPILVVAANLSTLPTVYPHWHRTYSY